MSTLPEVNEDLEGHEPRRWCGNCGSWDEGDGCNCPELTLDQTESASQWFDEQAIRDEREAARAEEEREWYYAQQLQQETDAQ